MIKRWSLVRKEPNKNHQHEMRREREREEGKREMKHTLNEGTRYRNGVRVLPICKYIR